MQHRLILHLSFLPIHLLIDSRALHHVTFDPNNLVEAIPTPADANVFLGNGQGLPLHVFGSATFF